MIIKEFDKDLVAKTVSKFSGLEHIGNGKNADIENYFSSFKDWLTKNDVLEILYKYNKTKLDLQNVNSYDFLIWLLHFGDVYDNLLRHRLRMHPEDDYKNDAIELYNLRQLHPKFSFAVAMNSQLPGNEILSDNDLGRIISQLAAIPDNESVSRRDFQFAQFGDGLYDAIDQLIRFSLERVAKSFS